MVYIHKRFTKHIIEESQSQSQSRVDRADLISSKKTDSLTVFFALLGSARVKAVSKMLRKSCQ